MTIQEQILAGLQQKFAGVETAILSRISAKKAEGVTDETKVNSIVEGISFSDVLGSYGDFRAGEAARTSVTNYEKKYGLKDGKTVETPEPTPEPTKPSELNLDTVSSLITEAITKAITPLTAKVEQAEAAKAAEVRLSQVLAKAKEYGIPESFARRYNISDDADLDAYFKEAKQELTNAGFEGNKVPDSPDVRLKKESDAIAGMISQGTKTIVENKK